MKMLRNDSKNISWIRKPNQTATKNEKEDLKLEDKINMFARQKGVLIHDIKYVKIQKEQMLQSFVAFVHHTAVNKETG